jgi:hypothetical protein
MNLAEKLRKGTYQAPKAKPYVAPTEAEIRKAKLASLKKFVRDNVGCRDCHFLDVPIFQSDLILTAEMSECNWAYNFPVKSHLPMFVKWAKKEGFIVERLHRQDNMNKDPLEFNKDYYIRLKW